MTWDQILENLDFSTSELSVLSIASTLLLAFALSLFIFFVYRASYKGVMYSKTFNVTLVAMSMITASIILAITSNIILSLGMVGALSIIRFRAPIKDPIDIAYLFWAVGTGIVCGAGLWMLAVISCVVIGIILFVFIGV
jgi:membrane-associated HD superfamily phosphohydrolase